MYVIKNLEMRSSWFIGMGIKSSNKCHSERQTEERQMEKRKRPCEDRGRDWN